MDFIYKLKTTFVTCTIELDLWTSNRSNLCFHFAVLQEHLGPVLKRIMVDFLEIEHTTLGIFCSLCIWKLHYSKAKFET